MVRYRIGQKIQLKHPREDRWLLGVVIGFEGPQYMRVRAFDTGQEPGSLEVRTSILHREEWPSAVRRAPK